MKNLIRLSALFLLCAGLSVLPGCVDQDFDEPPAGGVDPDLTSNTSIAALKALHQPGEFQKIQEEIIIEGIVVADDESGNFFRTIVIQDETAGINVRINAVGLYNDYPVGRRVFIKCRDLWLGDFANLIQLGGGVIEDNGDLELSGIEEVLLSDHIFKGVRDQNVEPKVTTISELTDADHSTLVRLEDVQFVDSDAGTPLADPVNRISFNLDLEDCFGSRIILRTSGFADFAGENAPVGNGSVTAIFSVFNNDLQLFVRDMSDFELAGERCGSGGVGGELITIGEVRNLFTGSTTSAPAGKKIKGVVISDRIQGNLTSRNLVVQDNTGGIVVRFTEDHSYDLNDEIEVGISGVELSEFNGLLQLNEIPLSAASRLSSGASIAPVLLTVAGILGDFEALESTLVRVENVRLSGSSTYDGTITLQDGTGSIDLFTRSGASFAGTPLPSDTVRVTAIVSQFNTPQLILRILDDVVVTGGGGPGGGEEEINEDFGSATIDGDVAITGWTNVATVGTRLWRGKEFDGNRYVQATAFNDTSPQMETWLVTPGIDLSEPRTLTFESAQAFYTHDGLSVWISTDFSGNVQSASWTELNCTLAGQSDPDHDWIPSGNVDLSAFSGTGYIGFKYVGNNSNGTTSYRVDNVVVKGQ